MIEGYTELVNELLEKPRNELEYKNIESNDKSLQEVIDKYDIDLLERYKFIEKYIDSKEQK